jgi:tellurite resistance protein TehA-like permease
VLGFTLFWAALATAITVRTARSGLPFSLTWWSFTFPVGTVVTATGGLATRTGSPVLTALAVTLFAVLLTAWTIVATRTLRGVRQKTLWPAAPQPVPATR